MLGIMSDAPWLDDAQLREWKSVMALLTTLPAVLDSQLKRDAGLNMFEYHVLVRLESSPDRTRPLSDLALLTQSSLSRLSHAMTRLERSGWVARIANPGGGRHTLAQITDDGVRKLTECAPGHAAEVRRTVVDPLSPDDLAALGRSARCILREIAPDVADVLEREG